MEQTYLDGKIKNVPTRFKEESKESEGSPEVKARMRRLQMEASQRAAEQAQAINDVKEQVL